jgi:pimeloyl-ACP methyl ester carboxylesterase
MPLESLSVGLLGILILGIYIPYRLKTKGLKKISSKDLPSDGNWVKLLKGNIYYRWHHPEQKNGQTIIMVHGFSTPSFVWNGLLDGLLNEGYSILVYDHYGRGFSERPRAKYSLDFYVETLKELISHQNIDGKIHLVGYSMGGPIIGGFADKYSNHVKSLSFIAPAGFGKVQTSFPFFMKIPGVIEWSMHVLADRFYGSAISSETTHSSDPLSINEEEFQELFSFQMQFKGFRESLASTMRNFNLFDAREMFEKVATKNIPSIAIWGDNDGVVSYKGAETYSEIFHEGKVITIKDGTHDITYRQPSQILKALKDFL